MKKDRKWRRSKIKSRCRAPAVLFNVDPTSLNQPITQRCLSAVLLYQLDTVVCLSFSSELLPPFAPFAPCLPFVERPVLVALSPRGGQLPLILMSLLLLPTSDLNSRRWCRSFISSLTFRRMVSAGFFDTQGIGAYVYVFPVPCPLSIWSRAETS